METIPVRLYQAHVPGFARLYCNSGARALYLKLLVE
jgi:hypothetical protein